MSVLVYQSLVLPVMDCCEVAWSSIGKIELDKLDRAQRRAAKIVLKTKDLHETEGSPPMFLNYYL